MATTKHKLTLTEITEHRTPVNEIEKLESVVYQQNFEDLDVNALIRELNKTKRRRKPTSASASIPSTASARS